VASYWQTAEKLVGRASHILNEVCLRTWTRQSPAATVDPFQWTGPHTSEAGTVIPAPDPDDPLMVTGYARLEFATAELRQREALRTQAVDTDQMVQDHKDNMMRLETGKTQVEWEEYVAQVKQEGVTWDWGRLEVRERKVPGQKALGMIGVYAKQEDEPVDSPTNAVIFQKDEVIGPLGGIIRRRSRYERLYYSERRWFLADPFVYELSLRAQTVELRPEPLVIDLVAGGPAQNRLRYIADVRGDPLGLGELLNPTTGPDSAKQAEPVLPEPHLRLQKPRSRPSSPYVRPDGNQGSDQPATSEIEAPAVVLDPNVRIVEVLIDGWPYVFVSALRDITHGEELRVDFGKGKWAANLLAMARVHEISRIGREIVMGAMGTPGEYVSEAMGKLQRERQPMARPDTSRPK